MNWLLLRNSLLVAGLTTVASGVLGFLAAMCLAGAEDRWRRRGLALAIMALAMPPFLVTNCWLDCLGETGVLHRWLPVKIYSLGGTVWMLALMTWPLSLWAVLNAWQKLEPSQLESEPALRGTALIRWLLWPLARSATGMAAALTFVLALNNFAVPAILQVKVLPAEVWVGFNTNLDTWSALQLGWPLVILPLLLVFLLARHENLRWPRLEGGVSARLFRRQLGQGWRVTSAGIMVGLVLVSVGAPLVQLAASRRTWLELWPALAAGWDAARNSVLAAALTATLVCVLAIGWPRRLSASTMHKTCRYGTPLLWLPLLVPGIFLGLALIWALNRPVLDGFYRSSGVVLLALVIRYFGPAWFGAVLALRSVDGDLIDAARLDGARGWTLVRRVIWPQIAPQVASVWYVVYLLCLWDVETLILIVPPGGETLAMRVFNLLHYGHSAQVNALCLWLLVVALAPLVLWRTATRIADCGLRIADRSRRSAALLLGLALAALVGCSRRDSSHHMSIDSQFFSHVEIIGVRGAGAGELNKPRSVALDRDDNLYVVDMTGRVQKFSPEGKFQLSWQMPQTDLGKAKGMARDQEGNIVLLEPHYQRVNHFSPEGKLVAQWGRRGTNAGEFSLPRAVTVNVRGEVIVSEYTLCERVQVFSAFGKRLLCSFGKSGTSPGEFNRPEGVGADAVGRIYVADSCNHRVQVFAPDGQFLRAYGQAGQGKGEFSYPYDICVDAAGRQYVCEFGNNRIQILDAKDQVLEVLGGPGAAPGRFANPWGLALDSKGNLYVADSQNHRVQKFVRKRAAQ